MLRIMMVLLLAGIALSGLSACGRGEMGPIENSGDAPGDIG
jgi:hypothetical protein